MTNTQHNSFADFADELNGEQELAFGDPSIGEPAGRENLQTDEAEMMMFYEVIGKSSDEEHLKKWLEAYKAFKAEPKNKATAVETHNPDLFEQYVYVNTEKKYYKKNLVINPVDAQSFNGEMNIHIPRDEKGRPVFNSAASYFNEKVRQFADVLDYVPWEPALFQDKYGVRFLNKFVEPQYPTLQPYEDSDVVRRIKLHLDTYYPEEAHEIIRWWAHQVQKPGVKLGWALAFVGTCEGAGKGLSQRVLQCAMTTKLAKNVDSSIINSPYNDWSFGSCVCCIDELMLEDKKVSMNAFKNVITNESISVNRKTTTILVGVTNTQNYVVTSNHLDALPVERSDRRWLVVDDKIKSLDEVRKFHNDPDYYQKLMDPMTNFDDTVCGEIRAWLLDVDISELPRNAPSSKAKDAMFSHTQSGDYHELLNIIDEQKLNIDMVSSKVLRRHYKDEMGKALGTKWAATLLGQMGLEKRSKPCKDDNDHNHEIYYNKQVYDADNMTPSEVRKESRLSAFKRV